MEGMSRNQGRGVLIVVFMLLIGVVTPAFAAGGSDSDRVEGVVEAVQSANAIRVRTPDRVITVDLRALGGVTVAVTPGEKIVAIGTMEPRGEMLHASRLESPGSR